jgi:hypothetical protein
MWSLILKTDWKWSLQRSNIQLPLIRKSSIPTTTRVVAFSREVWTYYSGAWSQTPTEYTKYVWDGWLLIAELDGNNSDAVLSTYTWGLDLSGTMVMRAGIDGVIF